MVACKIVKVTSELLENNRKLKEILRDCFVIITDYGQPKSNNPLSRRQRYNSRVCTFRGRGLVAEIESVIRNLLYDTTEYKSTH